MEIIGGKVSLRQIFLCRRAWLVFWTANILRLRWAIVWNVARMLLCRTGWGHQEYRCRRCGTTRRVPHTCKSRFCSSCGKAAVDRWVETTLSAILDVSYQHLVFTIPRELRDWIRMNRKAALNALFRAVKDPLLTWTRQRGYRPGLISVLHTFGADLKWNPHIHVIITCGGISLDETRWLENRYLPWQCLKPMYRYAFLRELKKLFRSGELKTPPAHQRIRTCESFNSYLTQFYKKEWYVHLGKSLKDADFTIRYVGRYGKRPVIAESRITAFDGRAVTFRYQDRATGEDTSMTLPVQEFIGRLVTHIPDQNFRCLRHAGIFANRVRTEKLEKARRLLGQNPKPAPQRISWREMFRNTFDHDPLECPRCGDIMQLTGVTFVRSIDIRLRVLGRHRELKNCHVTKTRAKQESQTAKAKGEKTSRRPFAARAPPQARRHLSLSTV
ncbi:MAG: IS91 family transposase [Myxococcota bacterium]